MIVYKQFFMGAGLMRVTDKIEWHKFIGRHDLIWDEIPYVWYDAPFLGNGFMGATVVFNKARTQMIINLGHTCTFDNRENIDLVTDNVITTARLPIGKYAISFSGKVTGIKLRLDLYNARLLEQLLHQRE